MACGREYASNDGGATHSVGTYRNDALGRRVLAADSVYQYRGRVRRYFYEAAGPSAGEIAFETSRPQKLDDSIPGDAFLIAQAAIRCWECRIYVPGPMGPNQVLMSYAVPDDSTEVFHHQDRQFSSLAETWKGGKVRGATSQYGAYGRRVAGGEAQAKGYTGGQEGAGGLVFLRNRYYDPNSGQFTQGDPIGQAGGANLYGYADNNPIEFSDPYGLDPEDFARRVVDAVRGLKPITVLLSAFLTGAPQQPGSIAPPSPPPVGTPKVPERVKTLGEDLKNASKGNAARSVAGGANPGGATGGPTRPSVPGTGAATSLLGRVAVQGTLAAISILTPTTMGSGTVCGSAGQQTCEEYNRTHQVPARREGEP